MLYDLLLRGGRVIDPAQSLDGAYDVAISEGRIAAVLPSIARSSAKETVDVSGKLVLPGLIDTHAHVFQYVTGRFGLEADQCRVVRQGEADFRGGAHAWEASMSPCSSTCRRRARTATCC